MRLLYLLLLIIPLIVNGQVSPPVRQPAQDRHDTDRRVLVQPATNGRIRVGTLPSVSQPFTMERSDCVGVDAKSNEECIGNKRYDDFCSDLMNAIRDRIPGKPQFQFVPNNGNVYGVRQPDGNFDGILGQVQRREVDMTCAPIVITNDRTERSTIEFSQPIMSTGIGIMMKRRESEDSCFSNLFRPFSPWTWFFILLTFAILLLARFLLLLLKKRLRSQHAAHSPDHRPLRTNDNGHGLHVEEEADTEFRRRQNDKINLVKNIRRLLKYLLWAFTFFVLLFYFANMIAHLVERRNERRAVQNLGDLMGMNNMRYGMVRNGATHQFFQQSSDPVHQQFLRNVESQNGFVSNYSQGIQQVRDSDGNYAFVMESAAIEYARREDCDTFQAGRNINTEDYALAMPAGSPWRGQIDAAIAALRSNGTLESMRQKWWTHNGEDCPTPEESNRLGWSDLCGLFLLLPLALLLGLLYILAKHFMKNRKGQNKRRNVPVGTKTTTTDQKRLHAPVVTHTTESTTVAHGAPAHGVHVHGHTNENPNYDAHRHPEPHVIHHPIQVESGRRV